MAGFELTPHIDEGEVRALLSSASWFAAGEPLEVEDEGVRLPFERRQRR